MARHCGDTRHHQVVAALVSTLLPVLVVDIVLSLHSGPLSFPVVPAAVPCVAIAVPIAVMCHRVSVRLQDVQRMSCQPLLL